MDSDKAESAKHEETRPGRPIQSSSEAENNTNESKTKNGPNASTGSVASAALWVSVVSAIISLCSMALTGFNFYFATYKPASVKIVVGPQVLLSSAPRIGGWFTLENNGALPTTITSATVFWDSPQTTFEAAMTSRSLDEWYFTEKGKRNVVAPTHFSMFSPIALAGRSDTNIIVWFTSNKAGFQFSPGSHRFSIAVFSGTIRLAEEQVELTLSDSEVRTLDPTAELPVEVREP